MIKTITLSIVLLLGTIFHNNCKSNNVENAAANVNDSTKNIYQFKVKSLDGGIIDFASFAGKKILIVNTASECGFTPQYQELEELYKQHKNNLVIIGFPANDFGSQEPGTDADIKAFCEKNYGVTFPMAAKVDVKGEDMIPLYRWLTKKSQNTVMDAEVKWNFNKFLIDEKGTLLAYYPSSVSPLSKELVDKL